MNITEVIIMTVAVWCEKEINHMKKKITKLYIFALFQIFFEKCHIILIIMSEQNQYKACNNKNCKNNKPK